MFKCLMVDIFEHVSSVKKKQRLFSFYRQESKMKECSQIERFW